MPALWCGICEYENRAYAYFMFVWDLYILNQSFCEYDAVCDVNKLFLLKALQSFHVLSCRGKKAAAYIRSKQRHRHARAIRCTMVTLISKRFSSASANIDFITGKPLSTFFLNLIIVDNDPELTKDLTLAPPIDYKKFNIYMPIKQY